MKNTLRYINFDFILHTLPDSILPFCKNTILFQFHPNNFISCLTMLYKFSYLPLNSFICATVLIVISVYTIYTVPSLYPL